MCSSLDGFLVCFVFFFFQGEAGQQVEELFVGLGVCFRVLFLRRGIFFFFFFQAEDGIRDVERSRGLGDVYKRQVHGNYRMPKKEVKKAKAATGKDKMKAIKKSIVPGSKKKSSKGKKKWSKEKTKEKLHNAVFFDKERFDKMMTEVPKMKLITIATVTDKCRITGSCARQAINELMRQGKIVQVGDLSLIHI
eukprot:TRINITY_DN2985_c0_g1_i2.p2 TRINITY_DN2985_c0_g1~~TRINITY_DN2985_c0_g1_i2.p2  ORF type:complete len:193 (-),score=66.65 TRINITY_DN2985_c0_g1_i2:188-766(-)